MKVSSAILLLLCGSQRCSRPEWSNSQPQDDHAQDSHAEYTSDTCPSEHIPGHYPDVGPRQYTFDTFCPVGWSMYLHCVHTVEAYNFFGNRKDAAWSVSRENTTGMIGFGCYGSEARSSTRGGEVDTVVMFRHESSTRNTVTTAVTTRVSTHVEEHVHQFHHTHKKSVHDSNTHWWIGGHEEEAPAPHHTEEDKEVPSTAHGGHSVSVHDPVVHENTSPGETFVGPATREIWGSFMCCGGDSKSMDQYHGQQIRTRCASTEIDFRCVPP